MIKYGAAVRCQGYYTGVTMGIQWRLDGDMKAIKYLFKEIKQMAVEENNSWVRMQELQRSLSDIEYAAFQADHGTFLSDYTPEKIVEMLQEYQKIKESMSNSAAKLNHTDNLWLDVQYEIIRFFNWASNNQETYPIITQLLMKYKNEK